MKILEYEDLGLFIAYNNSGFYLTEYKDEATTFGSKLKLNNILKVIDDQLCNKEPYYKKGHLVEVEM